MNDFETHERGTAEELRLSRKLARCMDLFLHFGGTLPPQVVQAHKELKEFYQRRIGND